MKKCSKYVTIVYQNNKNLSRIIKMSKKKKIIIGIAAVISACTAVSGCQFNSNTEPGIPVGNTDITGATAAQTDKITEKTEITQITEIHTTDSSITSEEIPETEPETEPEPETQPDPPPVTEGENNGRLPDYVSTTSKGYKIERIDGITYVDGIMVANKTYTLPADYDPGVNTEAYNAYIAMRDDAAKDGVTFWIISGYRSYYYQETVYASWVSLDGKEKADTYSSRPGHSDHQTGFTFDLNSLEQSFGDTAEGKWLAAHCAEYGFIIRYPKGKENYTGYIYEPWHIRYIGAEKAKLITESGLSLEEYYGISSDYAECEGET